jgi:hypothetical protein
MARKSWFRRFFAENKWPGLVAILYGAFNWIPDFQSRVQFWLGAAKMLGGKTEIIATVFASPLFGLCLVVAGFAYVLSVGEKRVLARSPIWPILGWLACGTVVLGFSAMLLVGYVVTQLGPRHLTNEQKSSFKHVFSAGTDLSPVIWIVSYPECFECRAYVWEFAVTINEIPKLKQKVGVFPFSQVPNAPQLSTDWRGVIVGAHDPKHLTDYQATLVKALHAAGIEFSFADFRITASQPNGTSLDALVLMVAPRKE